MNCELCGKKLKSAFVFVKGEDDFGVCCTNCYYTKKGGKRNGENQKSDGSN